MATPKSLSAKKAIALLKEGNSLTASGRNLDTLRYRRDGKYSWKGLSDQEATILEEKEVISLFSGRRWNVNLM